MDEPLNVAAIWPLGSDWCRGNERPVGSPGCLASASAAIDICGNLIHGARAVLPYLAQRDTPLGRWVQGLLARAHKNIVVVALANKLARIAWAVLAHGSLFDAVHMANA